jgi:hypothetical protein
MACIITPELLLGLVLILLNDESTAVRKQGLALAQTYQSLSTSDLEDSPNLSGLMVTPFSGNQSKPVSLAKNSKSSFTPLKASGCSKILKPLLKAGPSIIEDRNQLVTALNQVKNAESFEVVIRSINEYPTSICKAKLIGVLTQMQ